MFMIRNNFSVNGWYVNVDTIVMLFIIIIILFIPVSSQYVQQECSLRSPRRKNHVKSGKIAKEKTYI